MRWLAKNVARHLAVAVMLPRIAAFHLAARFVGRDRALEGSTQAIARVPGIRGQYLRRAFLAHAGIDCHPSAAVCFGTTFSKAGAIIEENVYIGPGCQLGLVHLERDVLLAAGVHVPSGAQTHGTADVSTPIRDQEGVVTCIHIGAGSWVGSGAIVMARVGRNCVIAAGAVVTAAIPDDSIAAGVPARVLRTRGQNEERRTKDEERN